MSVYERTREMITTGGPMPAIFITGIVIVVLFTITVILLAHFGIIKGGSMVNRMGFRNKYKSRKH
jgi:hypothetical protein